MDHDDDTPKPNPAPMKSKRGSDPKRTTTRAVSTAPRAALKLVSIEGETVTDGRVRRGVMRREAKAKALAEAGELPDANLTPKQDRFARLVAGGTLSLSDCYRQCYAAGNMTDLTIRGCASREASKPHVNTAIERYKAALYVRATHDAQSTKAAILRTLHEILDDPRAKHTDRMKAAELLGKWGEVGLFVEQSTIKVENVQPEEAASALLKKLKDLDAA